MPTETVLGCLIGSVLHSTKQLRLGGRGRRDMHQSSTREAYGLDNDRFQLRCRNKCRIRILPPAFRNAEADQYYNE